MKVFFHKGERWRWTPTLLESESNMVSLSFNNWDDYGISTTLNAVIYYDGKALLEFSLKLLIEGDKYSPKLMNEMRDNGWDGFFPIPNVNYVSVPSDISLYSILISKIGKKDAEDLLMIIRDAGYLTNIIKDEDAIRLVKMNDFNTSPLREAGARKAFNDGWMQFDEKVSSIQDFTLKTINVDGSIEPVSFHFNSKNLPYDINILIGPNGIGKSFTLKSLVEYWLGVNSGSKTELEKINHRPFDHYPNISKLILISYSPFEEFTIDLSKTDLKDKDAYKYFGFRKFRRDVEGKESIGISRNLPANDSVRSIIKALDEDVKYGFIQNWQSKFDTILSVLRPAIGFDSIGLEINNDSDELSSISSLPDLYLESDRKYIQINSDVYETLKDWAIDIDSKINFQSGVLFFKDNKRVELSSGQRLFTYIVINVVGQIKKDSLIVIDEPELFLHPTLEIEFITLLKKVLYTFNSKAILATHSLAIAREVPANCIHVYRKLGNRVEIDHPPFETFGGDMQRISSYVFCDNSTDKPFDSWINEKINEYGDPNGLIQSLGREINEEIMIKILNSGGRHGN
ncbi:ATP-binding protein [Chromobacterium vaccinii]|uniref:ATP-binding protein n=1 Tax=Chromobacterium vaccinii TaxID=1108595 RepID=UPI001E29FD9A|nr:ATP-binding protein [Chromobacterium vaccinii]MCD4484801.1 ATP-binding protein [Chromobacterium vaccinii]